jgi:hypothetical protein
MVSRRPDGGLQILKGVSPMKRVLTFLALSCLSLSVAAQTANYPEAQLSPAHAADTGSVNVLAATLSYGCPTAYVLGAMFRVLPLHANTTSTPTLNFCGLGAKTITKFGTTALANSDLTTTAIALFLYDGTDMELINPQTANGTSTITAVNTSGPLGGGGSTGSLTLTCTTCVTSASSLPSTDLLTGGGSQAAVANTNDQVAAGGIFTLYDNLTTAGLGFATVLGVSDVTAQSASQTTVNILASTPAAGHYLVRLYVDQNALCTTGTGSVYATVSWTDATHAHTALTVPLTLANTAISSASGFVDAAIPLWSATASAISYTTTYTACATGTGTYDLHAEVERTN